MSGFARSGSLRITLAFLAPNIAASQAAEPITIVILGDSYITGYGITPPDQFPLLLESALIASGHRIEVANQGFRLTTLTGASWLDGAKALEILSNPTNTVALLELGSNDCPLNITLEDTRSHLDKILGAFAEANIPALVVGTSAYPDCGAEYALAYQQIFVDLASKYDDLLYTDFKDGLYGHSELLQGDNDHPNAEGEAIIIQNILPSVEALMERVNP